MAVRFDAVGDGLTRATVPVPFSACGWAYMTTDRNDYTAIYSADEGAIGSAEGNDVGLYTDSDGTTLKMYNGSGFFGSRTLTAGTWFFWAMTVNSAGDSGTWYHAALGDASLYSATDTLAANPNNWNHDVGNNAYSSWWDGRIVVKAVWNAELTAAELEQERHTLLPRRTVNLYIWSPMFPGSGERTRDYSGNGRNWSEVGTVTDEDPPPVSYGAPVVFDPFVAAAAGIAIPVLTRQYRARGC